ncbi:hypothetical protein EJ03DRAFT_323188 [Teratosphaeria nubilosa]|uniref:Mediator of RNA polymerase II transcription subunit 12 n=1 Tax=Teratosphaeria nubilosa TaxID=161662 RepID=A0A6G1LLH3_9PEZI|nr:hypothetical protein EJ03DRAFT_323188 [Teratosphaeria nubilosa]
MDNRAPLTVTTTRPLPPQRAFSGNALQYPKQLQTRQTLPPSRLSCGRSASQPVNHVVDLTADAQAGRRQGIAFLSRDDGVVSSPGVIDLSGEDEGPPAKRAKTTGGSFRARRDGSNGHAQSDAAHQAVLGEPLPALPKLNALQAKAQLSRWRKTGGESPARHAHGLEPPAMAVRVPSPKNIADFSPWTGRHPEDVMNEGVVKAGYCDKGPGPNQTECNSAKPSIWQNLSSKNGPGLQILSSLYTQAMEKRQTLGRCTAPSTFKPPPRVTVTDTKREAWLRDLANPDIPLRKQSRTIPHGIRGKLLMDKCLAMDIPLQRAVWLAKCVGANELRAYRRKGINTANAANGEHKWVRDWTMQVEQFLEGVIATCGDQDWQLRMNYAVKLATALYAEKLVELDHYLDWMVTNFAEAPTEKLPIWIIVVQIYWKEIVRFIKRGRKLAQSILERLYQLQGFAGEVSMALKTRLQKLVAVLTATSPACLVLPSSWHRCKSLMIGGTALDSGDDSSASDLARRNERLAGSLLKTSKNTRCTLLDLYDELDFVDLNVDIESLIDTATTLLPDSQKLVPALLDYATTPFRYGLARIYLIARLIVAVAERGADTDGSILEYLSSSSSKCTGKLENVYRVVGELIDRDSFNVGRYLKWLISTSAVYAGERSRAALGLLAALPAQRVPANAAGLHRLLLNRVQGPDGIADESTAAVAELEEALVQIASGQGYQQLPRSYSSLAANAATVQIIRGQLPSMTMISTFTGFSFLRDNLEYAGDIKTLAMMLNASTYDASPMLLATISDTATFHAETLAALEQLYSIVAAVDERYRHLRTHQALDRTLILAMTTLAKLLPEHIALINLLSSDLVICEQQSTNLVCSPASDSLVNMHAARLESDEEIDAVFASGSSMDDQLLQRVFSRVMQRASTAVDPSVFATSRICTWLTQLRSLGGSTFDELALKYVRSIMSDPKPQWDADVAIPALVASRCLDMTAVAGVAKQTGTPHAAAIAVQLLSSTGTVTKGLSRFEAYRLMVLQKRCIEECPELASKLLSQACSEPSFNAEHPDILSLHRMLATRHLEAHRRAFNHLHTLDQLQKVKGVQFYADMVKHAITVDSSATHTDVEALFKLADPLSVHFCAVILACAVRTWWGPVADAALRGSLVQAVTDGNQVWPQLLGVASAGVKKHLHDLAQNQLLIAASGHDGLLESQEVVNRYMDVLAITSHVIKDMSDVAILTELVEKLREIEKQLSSLDLTRSGAENDLSKACRRLEVLLHVCMMHVGPSENENSVQVRGQLLTNLCAFLAHPILQIRPETLEHISDLAAVYADDLPNDALYSLSRSVNTIDTRTLCLFGTPFIANDAWLALASAVQPPGAQTQQQRALAKHAASQQAGQSGVRPGMATQSAERSTLQPQSQMKTAPVETKITPFPLRKWEIMPDAAPVLGENDASLNLTFFGARKA